MNGTMLKAEPAKISSAEFFERARARLNFHVPPGLVDPGIIPERFLIGAARFALNQRVARPGVITTNFYKALASG